MLLGAVFWTEVENFGKVKEYLRREHGLVAPTWPDGSLDQSAMESYLVYEDGNLVLGPRKGVYRANFRTEHSHGPHIGFRYWRSRLNRRIETEDPMRHAMLGTYEILKPVEVTDWVLKPIDLVQFSRRMPEYNSTQWERREYRGQSPRLSEDTRAISRILAQQFKENQFISLEVARFLGKKRENGEESLEFYNSGIFYSLTIAGSGLSRLYERGILERRRVATQAFVYRFVPEALRDLELNPATLS